MYNSIELEKNFLMILGCSPGAKRQVQKSRRSEEKPASSDSEFYADSEYVTLIETFFGQKNGLTATCPFDSYRGNIFGHLFLEACHNDSKDLSKFEL